jgi:uncharacterized YigZ family protein
MLCPKAAVSVEEIIKKSRFIGALVPCGSEREIAQVLKMLHENHPSASHIAYAYRVKTAESMITRFHDAGEPSGTAGRPILQHLEGKNLINCVLAVIRYFGGVKLGAGGLTRAYGNSAKGVIEQAVLVPFVEYINTRLQLGYKQMPALENLLKKLDAEIVEQDFGGHITLLVRLPKQHLTTLTESLSGF